jgi:serine/threonine protein kinase
MITLQKGRYQPLKLIGSGTTSRVEMARDNVIGRTVALKTFIRSFEEDLEEQFLREAQLVGQLSHPAIVQLYDVGINEQGTPFLVMEYIAGKTLEQRLGPFSLTVQRACTWAADLARALSLAHRADIIHGDIKPGNIFVTSDEKVKLGDFGIARLVTQASGPDRVLGTPAYLAPELIRGEPQDQRSDQFSFGVVFYQMLTGVRPFQGKSVGAVCSEILRAEPMPPSHHNPAVPPALDRVIARSLAKNPCERFASFEELVQSLYPYTRSRPRAGASPDANRSWWMQPSRHQDVWLVAAAGLLLAGSLQVPQVLHARFGNPPAPAHSYYCPGVPYEAFSYTPQTVAAAPESHAPADAVPPKESSAITSHMIHPGKIALASLNSLENPQEHLSNQSASPLRLSQSRTPAN